MFKKILLATDGSEDSLKAADYALELAKNNSASVEILVVIHTYAPLGAQKSIPIINAVEEEAKEMMVTAKEIIADTSKQFDAQAIPYETKILRGDPADMICDEAKEKGMQLIIVGTRGNSGIARWVMGSVSSKVVSHAPCSVLVAR